MPLPPEQAQHFDEQARLARAEFRNNWRNWSALDVAKWVERWYERTAYDRLCRIIREETLVNGWTFLPPNE